MYRKQSSQILSGGNGEYKVRKNLKEYAVDEKVTDFFIVKSCVLRTSNKGGEYMDMVIADNSGEMPAKVWDLSRPETSQVREIQGREVIKVRGIITEWNGEKQEVTVKSDDVTIVITIGAETALVNDKEVKLDAPAFIENDRTYTPIRFISENLGATVNWNGATEQVVITK